MATKSLPTFLLAFMFLIPLAPTSMPNRLLFLLCKFFGCLLLLLLLLCHSNFSNITLPSAPQLHKWPCQFLPNLLPPFRSSIASRLKLFCGLCRSKSSLVASVASSTPKSHRALMSESASLSRTCFAFRRSLSSFFLTLTLTLTLTLCA